MNLITPDTGLLFWMVVIFGLVFFLLWKFGFPIITEMVEKRNGTIEKSLKDAHEVEVRMAGMVEEHARMIEETRREQAAILREASETKNRLIADGKAQAREEADKIRTQTRLEIEAEKESAMRDIRKELALLSVDIAEKVLRRELDDSAEQEALVQRLVDEASRTRIQS